MEQDQAITTGGKVECQDLSLATKTFTMRWSTTIALPSFLESSLPRSADDRP
jgi:hypothetical protein